MSSQDAAPSSPELFVEQQKQEFNSTENKLGQWMALDLKQGELWHIAAVLQCIDPSGAMVARDSERGDSDSERATVQECGSVTNVA